MNNVEFTASAAFDRKLFWEAGGSVRFLVARVRARHKDDKERTPRMPLNIALVIDASGSMGGGKLEAAKAAALGLVERLSTLDRLTLVSFASDVRVHLDAVTVTMESKDLIQGEISRLQTRGATNLSGGWFAGVECAARVSEINTAITPRVIILSDGHANNGICDLGELCEHAAELRIRGVMTSALGIGDGYDEQLLRGIAENGGGRLHDAELTSEISSVLLGELDDIFGTIVEDAKIHLTVPSGVHAEVVGQSSHNTSGDRLSVLLGPVQSEFERVAVFKITCPKALINAALTFKVSAKGFATDDQSPLEPAPVICRLTSADANTNTSQSRDVEIAQVVARIWNAHVVSVAAKMNRDRAYTEAQKYVEGELLHFRRYVEGLHLGDDMVAALALLARRVDQQLSSRMHKEMVIQSSMMMASRVDRRGTGKAAWSIRMQRGD